MNLTRRIIMEYRNAKYINDQGWIDCEINHKKYGWIPYTIDPNDTDITVNNEELLAAMEANGDVAAYVPPTQEELDTEAAREVREKRDYLLNRDVDPLVSNSLRWADLTAEQQQAWTDYRRALLDITLHANFPHLSEADWPTKPE
jgi:hypothetical protein